MDRTARAIAIESEDAERSYKEGVIHCFEATGPDYRYWSRNLHMHFGLWRRWINPFDREALLEATCHFVFDHFGQRDTSPFTALDAGCGVGATLKLARERFPNATLHGITLLRTQAELAREKLAGLSVSVAPDDFEGSRFAPESFDVVFSIEAAVYAGGGAKTRYLKEMYRILKPGGVLIVLDGYLTKPARSMNSISMWIYNRVREGWWIEEMIDQRSFMSAATATGFVPERFRSLFLAVAPSAAHVPWVTLRYIWDWVARSHARSRDSVRHVVACACGCLLGLHRHRFTYGVAVLRKPLCEESGIY